ncbi:MAG: prolyl oligopeptidase family serine peptidase [Thermoguttaceae bacterium]
MTPFRFLLSSLLMAMVLPQTARSADDWQSAYAIKTFTDAEGRTLPYRLLSPERVEPGKTYPLVLFLHGAGERGEDNAAQLKHGVAAFAQSDFRRRHPCFVLVPQCPKKRRWVEVDWKLTQHTMPVEPSVPLTLAFELFDETVQTLPVDQSRLYIVGISMGGYGTWDAVQRRPDFFAAALPLCGGGDLACAPKLQKLPIWAFHGDADRTVPVVRTTAMAEAIQKAGGQPKTTIYPGVGHDCWTRTFANPAVLEWLFAQKKPR